MKKGQNSKENDQDTEYIGNIWGWKFSRWALVIIALLAIWVFIRSQNVKPLEPTQKHSIENAK